MKVALMRRPKRKAILLCMCVFTSSLPRLRQLNGSGAQKVDVVLSLALHASHASFATCSEVEQLCTHPVYLTDGP